VPDSQHKEWNVALDPSAYRHIFELPCPVYWMPCFDDLAKFEAQTHGTYWRFQQGEVLRHVSPLLQNYFLYAFSRNTDQRWLSQILNSVNQQVLETQSNSWRNMWCTAGFLHLAGLTATTNGELVEQANIGDSETLFHFRPVKVHLEDSGMHRWELTDQPNNHFLFEVNDIQTYMRQMPVVLRKLLERI